MFFILDFSLLSCSRRYTRATMSHHGHVTLSSQPCLYLIFFFKSVLRTLPQWGGSSHVNSQELFNTFSPHYVPICLPTYLEIKCCSNCVRCLYPFTQQAIIAISALGEMTVLWTKSGGKIALRVASENAIKREWCSEVPFGWISFCMEQMHPYGRNETGSGSVVPSHTLKLWIASKKMFKCSDQEAVIT